MTNSDSDFNLIDNNKLFRISQLINDKYNLKKQRSLKSKPKKAKSPKRNSTSPKRKRKNKKK